MFVLQGISIWLYQVYISTAFIIIAGNQKTVLNRKKTNPNEFFSPNNWNNILNQYLIGLIPDKQSYCNLLLLINIMYILQYT